MADHDAGYRRLFSDKRMVADLISGFVDETWVEELDLDMLDRINGSFVSDDVRKRENDVIWRVKFRDRWLYVYLWIEFQSTVDRFRALRLMVYVGMLYQRLIDEKQVSGEELLPPGKWPMPRRYSPVETLYESMWPGGSGPVVGTACDN